VLDPLILHGPLLRYNSSQQQSMRWREWNLVSGVTKKAFMVRSMHIAIRFSRRLRWCIRGILGWHGFRVGWSRAESKTTSKDAFISNAGDHGAAGGRTNFRTAFAKPWLSLVSVTALACAFTSLPELPIVMEKPPPQAVSIIEMIGLPPSANTAVEDSCQGPAFEYSTDLAKALAEDSS
jgi:hypothetical protein